MPDIEEPLERCCKFIEIISDNPENTVKNEKTERIKENIKNIYDYSKQEEKNGKNSEALQKLIIQNLDSEQIWQQLELQNNIVLKNVHKKLGVLISMQEDEEDVNDQSFEDENGESHIESDAEDDNINSDESETDEDQTHNDHLQDELWDGNSSEEEKLDQDKTELKSRRPYEKTEVDDDFFKLREMEDFLVSEEKKIDEKPNDHEEDSEEEDEDDVDYFAEDSDESQDEARMAKFKDFFVSKEEEKKPMKNKFLDELSEDEAENIHSNFELRQDRLQKRIEAIESNAVAEKPWTLKGEIRADSRPINSLLEEDVEFDRTTRPAPIVTGQTTVLLEDIIMQRIRDRAFDSVERKLKVVDTPFEYKKKLVVDQEKSKQSLAQIYENEFLEQKAALDPDNEEKEEEEPALHKEIRTKMATLFDQLDALSNYHYTPKPAIPEVKIISNIPALNLEEVAPVAVSDATLLAPAEIKARTKGEIKAKSERTDTDKKRERRKKKSKQRYHAQLKEKKEKEQLKTGKGKVTKDKADHLLKTLTKDSSIKKMVQSSESIKSSKSFFTQLDDKKISSNKMKDGNKRKNNNTSTFNAKKLKL